MEVFRLYILPVLLAAGAAILIAVEVRALASSRGSPGRWVKFGRRLTGGFVMLAIALMVHLGDTHLPKDTGPDAALQKLQHWMWVLGLVVTAMLLAVWDVMDGLRRLRSFLDEAERDDLRALAEHLPRREM